MLSVIRIVLIATIVVFCSAYHGGVTFKQLSACSEYRIESGYNYRNAFELANFRNNKPADDEYVRLKFFVQTTNDAHILLAATKNPRYEDKVYEIVFGGWGNTESVLRQKKQSQEPCSRQPAQLLSPLYPTEIEIRQNKDGVISVIVPGYPEPFMTCRDSSPVDVKFVSFSSWGTNAPSRWFYDCPFDNDLPFIDPNFGDTICVNTKEHSSATIVLIDRPGNDTITIIAK